MKYTAQDILRILDACCTDFTFPMLDNGYVYLAATRLSVFRSANDWALTIEIFGFSPRAGIPDINIYTFAGSLHNRQGPKDFVSRERYENYLNNNPHNESRFIYPIDEGDWQDEDTGENVARDASEIILRGNPLSLPTVEQFAEHGVHLQDENEVQVFELCRFLAAIRRNDVLASADELRVNVGSDLELVLQLDEWNHPNVVDESCRPSTSETFQQLAEVIVSGNIGKYQPSLSPNTHWRNWPEGGTL